MIVSAKLNLRELKSLCKVVDRYRVKFKGRVTMCKKECKECKCKRETPNEIVTGIDAIIDIEEFVDYDDIKYSKLIPSTTSPRNLLNRG